MKFRSVEPRTGLNPAKCLRTLLSRLGDRQDSLEEAKTLKTFGALLIAHRLAHSLRVPFLNICSIIYLLHDDGMLSSSEVPRSEEIDGFQ